MALAGSPDHGCVFVTDRIIRLSTVIALTGIPRSSLYRLIGEGKFPRQVPLSKRSVGWRESLVQRWIDDPRAYSDEP